MQNKIELSPGDTILFIGDSITDADRDARAYKPFGFGYVHFVANILLAKYPEYNLNIINRGVSGNTIRDLKNRWQKDCIAHKPDILSILIGVNDVWWQFAGEAELPFAVFPDEYETTFKRLLDDTIQKCNSQIVICEPFMFCDDLSNPVFIQLRRYVETTRRLAAELVRRPCGGCNAVLVPFQEAIGERIKEIPPQNWSDDMVHPHLWAHAWLAQQWLIATGL